MGVYSTAGNLNSILEGQDLIECHEEAGLGAAYKIVAESEYNYGLMMKSIGIDELHFLEENGVEMVYEAGDVKGFIGKAKEFFMNIFRKIQGLFAKFFAMLNGFVKSDKEFINKYKGKILSAGTKDFKYKGFNYTFKLDISTAETKMNKVLPDSLGTIAPETASADDADSILEKMKDKDEIYAKMRAAAIGESGDLTSAEFNKEIYSKLRDGEDTRQEIDTVNPSELISIISGTDESKKIAEKTFKEIKKQLDDVIKSLDKTEKALVKGISASESETDTDLRSKRIRLTSEKIATSKTKLAIIQIINGAILGAIKERNRQAKSVCASLVSRSTSHHESADYGYTNESSLGTVSSLNFI